MHHFHQKEHQKLATRIVLGVAAFTFIFVGVFSAIYGFKAANLETVKTLEEDTKLKVGSILFLITMLFFAAYASLVLRRPKSQRVIRSYTVFLFLWTLVFAGIAVMVPSEGQQVNDTILNDCRNSTSPIWVVDGVYDTANLEVCQVSCPCYANSSLWNESSTVNTTNSNSSDSTIASKIAAAVKSAQSYISTWTMFNNTDLAHNYQSCNLTTVAINSANTLLENATSNAKFGMAALGAVETDFACAGMCGYSNLYSFSDVSRGPPQQNCSIAVTNFVSEVSSTTQGWFWTFAVITFLSGVYLSFFWSEKHNKLESPLLGKH